MSTKPVTALIVDDEQPMRDQLRLRQGEPMLAATLRRAG